MLEILRVHSCISVELAKLHGVLVTTSQSPARDFSLLHVSSDAGLINGAVAWSVMLAITVKG